MDLIFRTIRKQQESEEFPFNFLSARITSRAVQLIDANTGRTLFRKTMVRAKPLSYPLTVGVAGGRHLNFYTDWGRKELNINDYDQSPYKFSALIFGSLAKSPQDILKN